MVENKTGFNIGEIGENVVIHKNINQEVIITTVDKLKIILMEFRKSLSLQGRWSTPVGILLTLIATLGTANFKDSLGLSSEKWEAIFIISSIFCGIWLIFTIVKAMQHSEESKLEFIIEKIIKLESVIK